MKEWLVNDDDKVHALSEIQNHGLSVQAIKAYASECTACGIGKNW
jgi:hypothetical protein